NDGFEGAGSLLRKQDHRTPHERSVVFPFLAEKEMSPLRRNGKEGRAMQAMQVTYADFEKIEMRVGKVIRAEPFPRARKPAYRLWIDFGALGIRKSSAQITKLYKPEDLIGRQVIAVTNFPPLQVADFMSEVLVLGVVLKDGEVSLIGPDREVPLGSRIL